MGPKQAHRKFIEHVYSPEKAEMIMIMLIVVQQRSSLFVLGREHCQLPEFIPVKLCNTVLYSLSRDGVIYRLSLLTDAQC